MAVTPDLKASCTKQKKDAQKPPSSVIIHVNDSYPVLFTTGYLFSP